MKQMREQTMRREKKLRDMGYEIRIIWEHEWNAQKKNDPILKDYIENLDIQPRLKIRDSFFGGRQPEYELIICE